MSSLTRQKPELDSAISAVSLLFVHTSELARTIRLGIE